MTSLDSSEPLQLVGRTKVRWRGRELLYFGGCDYFRLARHPEILRAIQDGMNRYGLSVSASRFTTGNHVLYTKLEKELARFFDGEAALLTNSGYASPIIAAQGLAGVFTQALLDEYAHSALRDAAQALRCPVRTFKHRDAADLKKQLAKLGRGCRPIVLTDGMFAHDGSTAPLAAYLKGLPTRGWLLVDDAHGAGTLGHSSKGTIEVEGIGRNRVIQCITLSKAFGSYGGAVICSDKVREQIISKSLLLAGSTPLPLPLVCAAFKALRLLRSDRSMRNRLESNTRFLREAVASAGWKVDDFPGPILSLQPASQTQTSLLRRRLLTAGILPPLIRYPGSPRQGYFRFVVSSGHTTAHLKRLAKAISIRLADTESLH